jgi:hypothetical protein
MSNIVVGKRIPIGAAVAGAITFGFAIWNKTHPEMQFSVAEVGAFSTVVVASVQIFVVNYFGATEA